MMIEVMAGKSAAIHGIVHDASPFRFSEENPGVDYHGRLLEQGNQYSCFFFSNIFFIIFYNISFLFLDATRIQPDMTTTVLRNCTVELMEEKWKPTSFLALFTTSVFVTWCQINSRSALFFLT